MSYIYKIFLNLLTVIEVEFLILNGLKGILYIIQKYYSLFIIQEYTPSHME